MDQGVRRRAPSRAPRSRSRKPGPLAEMLESRQLLSTAAAVLAGPSDYGAAPAVSGTTPMATPGPSGYSPAQVASAYGFANIPLPNSGGKATGAGETIAIVDAYNDPKIQSDLTAFDKQFGLSDPPKFQVVNQSGATSPLPATDSGWAEEISLDVEWAHAVAPQANILLVEASSSSLSDLMAAVKTAATSTLVGKAAVVSMSWGGSEFSGETGKTYDGAFSGFAAPDANGNGIVFVASAGDSRGVSWPAASPSVVGVGGTTLNLSSSGGYGTESAWRSSGGGMSRVEPAPGYQNQAYGFTRRETPDVGFDANPNTGVAVYDSQGSAGGWIEVGGTSAGAPQWAGLVALADQGRAAVSIGALSSQGSLTVATESIQAGLIYGLAYTENPGYNGTAYFHDITVYPAGTGYDLYTGLGTPVASAWVPYAYGQAPAQGAAATSGGGAAPGTSSSTGPGTGTTEGGGPGGGTTVPVHRFDLVVIVAAPAVPAVAPAAVIIGPPAAQAPATALAAPTAPAPVPAAPAGSALVPVAQPLSGSTASTIVSPSSDDAEPPLVLPPEIEAGPAPEPAPLPQAPPQAPDPDPAPVPETAPAPAPVPDDATPVAPGPDVWDAAVSACVGVPEGPSIVPAVPVAPPGPDRETSPREAALAAGAATAVWGCWTFRPADRDGRRRRPFAALAAIEPSATVPGL